MTFPTEVLAALRRLEKELRAGESRRILVERRDVHQLLHWVSTEPVREAAAFQRGARRTDGVA